MKPCIRCGKVKPLDEFYPHKGMRDGRLNVCIPCKRGDSKKRQDENPLTVLESRMRSCERNPSKMNARRAVHEAVRAGVLVKPRVCRCGKECRGERSIHAHHYDYSKPLVVEWLCPKCHAERDSHKWEKVECPKCGRVVSSNRLTVHKCL